MRTPVRYVLVAAALVVPLVACSSGSGKDTSDSAANAGAAPAEQRASIKTFAFQPKALEVKAGTKVTWTNEDQILHTVTSGTREADAQGQPTNVKKDGKYDLQLNGAGASGSFTFSERGTFAYFCDRHPGMDATVVVS